MLLELPNGLYYNNTKAVLTSSKICDEVIETENHVCNPLISTHLVLVINNYCQLRCLYCYSDTNNLKSHKSIDIKTAENAIERVFTNSHLMRIYGKRKKPCIVLHGGGEPTLSWETVKKLYSCADCLSRQYSIDFEFTIVTNGILDEQKNEWLYNKNVQLQISIDGPKFIHDLYRPTVSNRSSFDELKKCMFLLNEKKIRISSRITYYKDNQNATLSFIKYICDNFHNCDTILIGILHSGGRGDNIDNKIDVKLLADTIESAKAYAKKYNVNIIGPSERALTTGKGNICNAYRCKSLIVNYNSDIINCHEKNDYSENVIGTFNKEPIIDNSVVQRINKTINSELKRVDCVSCIGYSVCRGACPYERDDNYCNYIKERMQRALYYYCRNNSVVKDVDWIVINDYYETHQ